MAGPRLSPFRIGPCAGLGVYGVLRHRRRAAEASKKHESASLEAGCTGPHTGRRWAATGLTLKAKDGIKKPHGIVTVKGMTLEQVTLHSHPLPASQLLCSCLSQGCLDWQNYQLLRASQCAVLEKPNAPLPWSLG